MQLFLISITKYGSDQAVVLNGNIICKADPCCGDDLEIITTVAGNLQTALMLPVTEIEFKPIDNNWDWDIVMDTLISEGTIKASSKNSLTLLDTVVQDWRLQDAVDSQHVQEKDRCEYALRIEQAMPDNKIWIEVYNKAFDRHGCNVHKSGLHCFIEIRDGVPALSVGISPDENIIHILSNTSNILTVIPDAWNANPKWMPVDFVEAKHKGLCFPVDDYNALADARLAIAHEYFEGFDFGNDKVNYYFTWIFDGEILTMPIILEDKEGNITPCSLEVVFRKNGTHIVSSQIK